jgi:hypothetical protein
MMSRSLLDRKVREGHAFSVAAGTGQRLGHGAVCMKKPRFCG